jgi:hypothetical protein
MDRHRERLLRPGWLARPWRSSVKQAGAGFRSLKAAEGGACSPRILSIGADSGHQEHRGPRTRVATNARGWGFEGQLPSLCRSRQTRRAGDQSGPDRRRPQHVAAGGKQLVAALDDALRLGARGSVANLPLRVDGNVRPRVRTRMAGGMWKLRWERRQATRNGPPTSLWDAFRPDGLLPKRFGAKVCSRLPSGNDDVDRLNSLPRARTHQLCADTRTQPP